MIQKLQPKALRWRFENLDLVREVLRHKRARKPGRIGAMAQERAVSALELGFGIRQRGFNIFIVGSSGTGRTSTVTQMLNERARKEPTPNDTVLLYNFDDRDRPLALLIPPSSGPKLKKTYDSLVDKMLFNLEKAFEAEHYLSQRQEVQETCRAKTDAILEEIEETAMEQGFVLSRAAGSLTLVPAGKSGSAITEAEFEELSEEAKQELESRAEKLDGRLEDAIRKVRGVEKEGEDAIEQLERETANRMLAPLFENAKSQWKNCREVQSHLDAMREDVVNRIRRLIPDEAVQVPDAGEPNGSQPKRIRPHDEEEESEFDEPALLRYRVNILVTNPKTAGAPVVQETHPTSSNLIGRIEQRLRAGETITDFTRIRAGALYRANGGYLLLEAQDLLRDPSAWEGLKRALKNRAVELDDPGEPGRMVSMASIRPEPVPLSLKVVLIGTPDLYYMLSKNDPDFCKLFKVKADFDVEMERSPDRIHKYLQFLFALCQEEKLRRLTPEGAAGVMEHAVRLAGNQKKLTARIGDIADLVRESNFWAAKDHSRRIDAKHVQHALKAKAEREGCIELHMINDILDGKINIETEGQIEGQCNALTVIEVGNYVFGVPIRITCRIGCGRGEIIDIERETELGGPLHTKGTLIIRGLLSHLFGREIPLGLTATICMEQTYTDIDGDSASLAETCALLSMLADVPILQRFAITGSIDQRGNVQAVGGINEKIEGFFNVCNKRGGKEPYGVIIPAANTNDIMLKDEIVHACEKGSFQVFTVNNFRETIELLTERSWDKGKNSIRNHITDTLEHLQHIRVKKKYVPMHGNKKEEDKTNRYSSAPEIAEAASRQKR